MDNKVSLMRTSLSTTTPRIDWSYEFYNFATSEGTDKDRRKDPTFITLNPQDNRVFYLSGREQGYASVMKFQKRSGKMDWWAQFTQLSSIRAVAELPDDENFYGCGDWWENEDSVDPTGDTAQYSAGIFKMNADGRVKWYLTLSGSNPTTDMGKQDRCYGLSVDTRSGYITALM
jgi:hypothetical protein